MGLPFLIFTVFMSLASGQRIRLPDPSKPFYHRNYEVKPGETISVQSENYPGNVGSQVTQIMNFGTNLSHNVEVKCDDLRTSDTGPCVENVVVFKQGKLEQKVCGIYSNFNFVSNYNVMTIKILTGPNGSSFLRCRVTAKEIEAHTDFNIVKDESEEIDSSEHGGPPGRKTTNCGCGWANKPQQRVIGGEETGVNEFPFMAALTRGSPYTIFCGASIVTEKHAISAAHCTTRKTGDIHLLVGEHNWNTDRETSATKLILVKEVIDHPNYDGSTFVNDITILVLSQNLVWNQFIGPICLPDKLLSLDRQYVKIIGWGRYNSSSGYMSPFLKKVNLRVLPKKTCDGVLAERYPNRPLTNLCVLGIGKSSCNGDSGGPLAWIDPETNRYTLVGLVSFRMTNECDEGRPTIDTDVSVHLDWIHRTIRETSRGLQTCSKVN